MKSKLLRPFYDKAIQGLPVLGTPADVAARFGGRDGWQDADGDRIVALYTSLSGATGFVLGLPGFLLMPVTLPADMAGAALLQLHMSATFAHLAGRDLHAPETRDACIDCLLEKITSKGKNSEEEEVASRTSVKLLERGVRYVLSKSAKMAGKAARNYALRRIGARRLPVVGGLLGAGSNAYVTAHVGRCAQEKFLATAEV